MNELLRKSFDIKQEINRLQAELKTVNAGIVSQAIFPKDKATATITEGTLRAKIVNKETLKWDQAKLNNARQILGDEKFLSIFDFEWKPASKKDLDGFLQYAPKEQAKHIIDALSISLSTSVTVEIVELGELNGLGKVSEFVGLSL